MDQEWKATWYEYTQEREDEGVKINLEVATYGRDLTRGALKARPSLL